MKILWLAGAGIAALGGGVCHAQTVPDTDEIIVTATRRAATINTVPLSISAFDQKTMDAQGVRTIGDLGRITPGLNLIPAGASSTGGVQVAIRGITSLAGAATTGVYIDDVPIQPRIGPTVFPNLFDLQRVEVLRGPQGTLFGAGSQGGTLRFITPQPSLTETSGYFRAEAALTEHGSPTFEAGGAVGMPLVRDAVGARLSLWARHNGGYVDRYSPYTGQLADDDANSVDAYVARLSLLIQPTERFSITPTVHFEKSDRDDSDVIWRRTGKYKSEYDIPQPTKDKFLLSSVIMDYDAGIVGVKSITSYFSRTQRGTNRFFHSFAQGLYYPQIPNYTLADHQEYAQRNFSQELRFTSTGDGPLSIVAGVFYQNNKNTYYEDEDEPLVDQLTQLLFGLTIEEFGEVGQGLIDGRYAFIQKSTYRDKEIAGFGDVTYQFTDRLKASIGLRYSKTTFNFRDFSDGPLGALPSGPLRTSGRSSEKPFTPKFNLSYDIGDGLVYATVAKGYRMGGANGLLPNLCAAQLRSLGIDGAPPPYSSDTVWSYELGAKKRVSRALEVQGSVYQIDWQDIQGGIPLNSCAYSFTSNFGKARVRGFDLQVQVRPAEGLTLSGTVAYNNGKYRDDILAPGSATLLSRDGDPILFSPKWQATGSAEYRFPVADREAYLRADTRYTSSYYRTYSEGVTGYLASTRFGQAIYDTQVRAGVSTDGIDLSAFVTNLFNEDAPVSRTYGTRPNTVGFVTERYTTLRPRTYGLTAAYRF